VITNTPTCAVSGFFAHKFPFASLVLMLYANGFSAPHTTLI
jgi:hypothetical protein